MANISATRYNTFLKCPLQYKYKYKYRLLSDKSDALVIGSLYHEMLESYHKHGHTLLADQIANSSEHKDILEKLFAKYLAQPVLGKVMETEYEFTVDIPGVEYSLYGFIDTIDEDKGVEYKTSSRKWNTRDTDTIQTDIYMYVLYKRFGRPFPLVYSINNKKTKLPPQIIVVEKTEEEILALEDKIKQYIIDVKESTFDAKPGSHCYLCPWGSKGDGTCPHA